MNSRYSPWIVLIVLLALLGAAPTYTAIYLTGASSGTATIQPPAAAGTPTLTLPTATGTIATRTGSITTNNCAKFDSSGRLVDSGGACGTYSAPDRTVTSCGSCTLLAGDMGGQVNYNGSSLTATIPAISGTVLAAGMQVVITNQHSSDLTISSTPTLNGYSGSTIPQYGGLACTSNGTSLDCLGIGTAAAGAGGSVTTSGSPSSGNLAKFSGSSAVTNADLTGDVTTSGGVATTVGKVNGVTYGASPSTNTVPVITSSNTVTYEAVPNAALANAATTVNGQTCTLGSSCTVTATAGTVTVGTTAIASGTHGRLLYDSTAVLGESAGVTTDGISILSLGVAGASFGTVTMNNTTSGTVSLRPVGGALGTVVASLPANTGTIAELNLAQTWTAAQSVSVEAISSATSTLTPTGTKNDYSVTLTHANTPFTLANMTAIPAANTHGIIKVTQSATGSDLISTWGAAYKAPGGTSSIILSTGANAVDILAYVSDGTSIYITPLLNFSH